MERLNHASRLRGRGIENAARAGCSQLHQKTNALQPITENSLLTYGALSPEEPSEVIRTDKKSNQERSFDPK